MTAFSGSFLPVLTTNSSSIQFISIAMVEGGFAMATISSTSSAVVSSNQAVPLFRGVISGSFVYQLSTPPVGAIDIVVVSENVNASTQ